MPQRFRSERLRDLIKTARGKSYTVGIATAVLVMVLFLFAVFPAASSIITQSTENVERNQALLAIEQKRTNIRNILTSEQSERALTVALSHSLPDTLEQDILIKDIQDLATTTGVKLISTKFTVIDPTRVGFPEFELNVEVIDGRIVSIIAEGDRTEIEKFIANIEEFRRVMNIRTISVIKSDAEGSALTFRLTLQAEVYFWNQPQESDTSDQLL